MGYVLIPCDFCASAHLDIPPTGNLPLCIFRGVGFGEGRPKVDNSRLWTISPRTTRKHLLEFQAGAYTILSSHQATPASPRLRRTDAPLFTFLTIHMTLQDTRGHLTAPCLLLCVDYRYILCTFRFWPTPGKLMSCWIPWLHLHADHGGSTSSQCERKDSERSRLCLGSCRLEWGSGVVTARLTLTEVARRAVRWLKGVRALDHFSILIVRQH